MPTVHTESILGEVLSERELQKEAFSQDHDDALRPADWVTQIVRQLGYAVLTDRKTGEVQGLSRKQLIRVAAVAAAAVEAIDRKTGVVPLEDLP